MDHLSEGKQVYPMCGTSFIRCVTLLTDVSSALSLPRHPLSLLGKRNPTERRVVFLTNTSFLSGASSNRFVLIATLSQQ